MKQFNLDEWLQDKSRKVTTRNGKPVRIVCWDKLGDYPIIGCIKYSDDYEDFESYNINGSKYSYNREDPNDLFFADEENELTEFEKTMIQFSHERNSLIQFEHTTEEINVHLNRYSKKLLDLVKKEYWRKPVMAYKNGYEQGKEDALKDLPKWKKMPNGILGNGDFNPTYLVRTSNGYYFTTSCISWNKDNMYIELSELEKLLKEE